MRAPHEFPRRVLALAVGLTPQVVTETVYALAVARQPAWVPTEVRVLTTSEGAARARLTLLDPDTGQFGRLLADYGLAGQVRFDANAIQVIDGPAGPLADIRNPAENARAADAITTFVRELCRDEDAAVHVSIAGGRKTMGYYLGYALSLFGREQDRLSHVLVNEPFEQLRDFYYPPARPKVLYGQGDRPASTADARVELAEIPFVRLRAGLPASLVAGEASFVDSVEAASRRFAPAMLGFETDGRSVVAGDRVVRLPPLLWAWYALLAQARVEGWGESGAVRAGEVPARAFVAWYARAVGSMSPACVRLEERLRRHGLEDAELLSYNAKLNRQLASALGVEAAPYLVQACGRRPGTRHGIAVEPARVRFPTAWAR